MRVMLIVEYDGTNYAGWQRQKGVMTVQEMLENAITAATGKPSSIAGAGRTDAGVHALGQCAHFDTDCTIPPEKLSYALNLVLPEDIRIRESMKVSDDFHSIRDAKRKHYRYTVYNAQHACAVNRRTCTHIRPKLDECAMHVAAQYLKGRHDFLSFVSSGTVVKDTVRKIYAADVTRIQDYVYFDFVGNGFLYNMVRIMVGSLLEVGKKRKPPEWIKQVLEGKLRELAGATAPAKGLMMMSVYYDNNAPSANGRPAIMDTCFEEDE